MQYPNNSHFCPSSSLNTRHSKTRHSAGVIAFCPSQSLSLIGCNGIKKLSGTGFLLLFCTLGSSPRTRWFSSKMLKISLVSCLEVFRSKLSLSLLDVRAIWILSRSKVYADSRFNKAFRRLAEACFRKNESAAALFAPIWIAQEKRAIEPSYGMPLRWVILERPEFGLDRPR